MFRRSRRPAVSRGGRAGRQLAALTDTDIRPARVTRTYTMRCSPQTSITCISASMSRAGILQKSIQGFRHIGSAWLQTSDIHWSTPKAWASGGGPQVSGPRKQHSGPWPSGFGYPACRYCPSRPRRYWPRSCRIDTSRFRPWGVPSQAAVATSVNLDRAASAKSVPSDGAMAFSA
jgi:hypothetical protein